MRGSLLLDLHYVLLDREVARVAARREHLDLRGPRRILGASLTGLRRLVHGNVSPTSWSAECRWPHWGR